MSSLCRIVGVFPIFCVIMTPLMDPLYVTLAVTLVEVGVGKW